MHRLRLGARALVLVALFACDRRVEPKRARIVVSNENAGTVTVIDARSHQILATIPVGKRPRGIRISKDNARVYVALSGSPKAGPGVDARALPPADRGADGIGVIDLDRLHLVRTLPSGQDPESFDLAGNRLAISNEETAEVSLVDLESGGVIARVPAGGEPEGVTTAPDGTVWVTSEADHRVTAIDPVRGAPLGGIPTGQRPRSIAFTSDNAVGVVPAEIDGAVTLFDPKERKLITRVRIPAPAKPMGVVVDRNDKRAYITTGRGGGVAVLDLATREVSMIEHVGARPWGIAIDDDNVVYTANGPGNDISIIDAAGTIERITVGGSPWGVAVTR